MSAAHGIDRNKRDTAQGWFDWHDVSDLNQNTLREGTWN